MPRKMLIILSDFSETYLMSFPHRPVLIANSEEGSTFLIVSSRHQPPSMVPNYCLTPLSSPLRLSRSSHRDIDTTGLDRRVRQAAEASAGRWNHGWLRASLSTWGKDRFLQRSFNPFKCHRHSGEMKMWIWSGRFPSRVAGMVPQELFWILSGRSKYPASKNLIGQ